jgi:hypothetical protein
MHNLIPYRSNWKHYVVAVFFWLCVSIDIFLANQLLGVFVLLAKGELMYGELGADIGISIMALVFFTMATLYMWVWAE